MNMYGIYLFRTKNKMGYILYSKNINASHICPPTRNYLFQQRKWNWCFRENIDFDLQNTYQSNILYENLKWSHGHYGYFALDDLTENPDRNSIFDKSVESEVFQKSGTQFGVYIQRCDAIPTAISMTIRSGLD